MTQLSVNVNKIAVLRNSRGGAEPDVVRAAQACLDAGAHGITVHPRPDRRHHRRGRAGPVHADPRAWR
jgi:pyridoxine 5-phosphate synthase